jgi:hypothetical protein
VYFWAAAATAAAAAAAADGGSIKFLAQAVQGPDQMRPTAKMEVVMAVVVLEQEILLPLLLLEEKVMAVVMEEILETQKVATVELVKALSLYSGKGV